MSRFSGLVEIGVKFVGAKGLSKTALKQILRRIRLTHPTVGKAPSLVVAYVLIVGFVVSLLYLLLLDFRYKRKSFYNEKNN